MDSKKMLQYYVEIHGRLEYMFFDFVPMRIMGMETFTGALYCAIIASIMIDLMNLTIKKLHKFQQAVILPRKSSFYLLVALLCDNIGLSEDSWLSSNKHIFQDISSQGEYCGVYSVSYAIRDLYNLYRP